VIHGYPEEPSVLRGGHLVLRVSTDAPAFRVLAYRCGASMDLVAGTDWYPGRCTSRHLPFQDWGRPGGEQPGWAGYRLEVPLAWRSGVYVAVLVEGDGGPLHNPATTPGPDARSGQALFVVQARGAPGERRAPILYKLPLLTYHAYNVVVPDPGRSWSLYTLPEPLPAHVPPSVSVHRPGGGTGGTPWDIFNRDPFDLSPRQTFRHWDAPFVAWLEGAGYEVDYCTDLDLHHDPELLDGYALLLSAGHDEYWTDAMRDRTEGFVRDGGNVAFFGGNTCWWRVVFDDDHAFRRVAPWSDPDGPDRPENVLTGVSFRNGGERDRDDHPVPVGYAVQHADHWVFVGTGLQDGDIIGGGSHEYVVGYEADGAHFDRSRLRRGLPVQPTGDDGTPAGFTILGIGDTAASGWGFGNAAATMGLHTAAGTGGTVFTGATTDWPRVLAGGTSHALEQVTHNVVRRLSVATRGVRPDERPGYGVRSAGTGAASRFTTR
jgi:hypothetical protein